MWVERSYTDRKEVGGGRLGHEKVRKEGRGWNMRKKDQTQEGHPGRGNQLAKGE